MKFIDLTICIKVSEFLTVCFGSFKTCMDKNSEGMISGSYLDNGIKIGTN